MKENQKIYTAIREIVGDEYYQSSTRDEQELDKKFQKIANRKAENVFDMLSNFKGSCTCENEIIVIVNPERNNHDPYVSVKSCCSITFSEIKKILAKENLE